MSQTTAHPYRQQLPSQPSVPLSGGSNQVSLQSAHYQGRLGHVSEPSTASAVSNSTYVSAQGMPMNNSQVESDLYATPQGSASLERPAQVMPKQKKNYPNMHTASGSLSQPPSLAGPSSSGSSDSLPLPPPVIGGTVLTATRSSSPQLQPPDTPVGARSFSLPPQMHEDFNKSHHTSRSDSPASLGAGSEFQSVKSHSRQSKSIDLSHMYLLDRNESTHFTLTNESLSAVSQNLIRQYLGENSSSSLLPRMKTIEMYRKNVKKSNDPKVLFQYAQYMLQTALTMDQPKSSESSPNPDGGPTLEKNMKKQFLKEAIHYLKKLSDKGYTDAQYLLGDAYSSGALGKVDNKEAFNLFQGAAKHGHVESAYRTAYCYEEGLGVSRDSRRAIEFLKYAASKNHPAAMYKLGVYSFYGRLGLPDNVNVKKSGIQWLSRAVTKANELTSAAPYELGKIYDEGFLDIVIPDHKYAMELYVQAASLGHIKSAAILGRAYELGDDVVPQDGDLSVHYYTQAALGGDPESMLALCAWYLLGNPPNLEKDNFEAFQWAMRAAKAGLPKAQSTLGHFYEKGIGCEAQIDSAKYWYTLAMENGDERAKGKLMKLSSTSEQTPPGTASSKNTLKTQASSTSILESIDILPDGTSKKSKKKEKKEKKEKKDKDCVIM